MPLLGNGSYGGYQSPQGPQASGPGGLLNPLGMGGGFGMDPMTAGLLGISAGAGRYAGATRLPSSMGQAIGGAAQGLMAGQGEALKNRLLSTQIPLTQAEMVQKQLQAEQMAQRLGFTNQIISRLQQPGQSGQPQAPQPPQSPGSPVPTDITDQDYVARTAINESRDKDNPNGNPNAVNGSHVGLGQFDTAPGGTWDYIYNKYLKDKGYKNDPRDPEAAKAGIAALAYDNAKTLTPMLGTAPTNGQLYTAHFLGVKGASGLIAAAPDSIAADAANKTDPGSVFANQSLFYPTLGKDAQGHTRYDTDHPYTVAQFEANMESKYKGTKPFFQGAATDVAQTQYPQTSSGQSNPGFNLGNILANRYQTNPLFAMATVGALYGDQGAWRGVQSLMANDPELQRAITYSKEGRDITGAMTPGYALGSAQEEASKEVGKQGIATSAEAYNEGIKRQMETGAPPPAVAPWQPPSSSLLPFSLPGNITPPPGVPTGSRNPVPPVGNLGGTGPRPEAIGPNGQPIPGAASPGAPTNGPGILGADKRLGFEPTVPSAENQPGTNSNESVAAITERQKLWAPKIQDYADTVPHIDAALMMNQVMAEAMKATQTGQWDTAEAGIKSHFIAAGRLMGQDWTHIFDNLSSPTDVQRIMKSNWNQTLQTLEQSTKRPALQAMLMTSQSNANADLQPGANKTIMGETGAMLAQARDMAMGWDKYAADAAAKGKPADPNYYEKQFAAQNPLSKYQKAYTDGLGLFKGEEAPVPHKSQMDQAALQQTYKNRIGTPGFATEADVDKALIKAGKMLPFDLPPQ